MKILNNVKILHKFKITIYQGIASFEANREWYHLYKWGEDENETLDEFKENFKQNEKPDSSRRGPVLIKIENVDAENI